MRWRGGRSGRIRTRDLRFWRPLLYQLSYAPAKALQKDSSTLSGVWSICVPFVPYGTSSGFLPPNAANPLLDSPKIS